MTMASEAYRLKERQSAPDSELGQGSQPDHHKWKDHKEAELRALKPDKVIDARGTCCPGPLLDARRAMASMKVHQILETITSDDSCPPRFQDWTKKMGYDYLGSVIENGNNRIFVRRTK